MGDEGPELTREQLGSLITVCPLIMDHLRTVTLHTADLFQQSFAEDYDNVRVGLGSLSAVLQENPSPMISQMASIFSNFKPSVWANALRLILTQSQPRVIPAEIGTDIVGTIPRLHAACTVTEACHILGPLLDKLPRKTFDTLGQFCALLRDTGSNATLLACLVGPQLLLPNLLINAPKNQGPGALAAAAVFELMITESESLFGRSAAKRHAAPYGQFSALAEVPKGKSKSNSPKMIKKVDASVDFEAAAFDPDLKVAKASLRAFYDWRDPMKSSNTDRLFQRLKILSIGHGLQSKYGLIPPGWGIILRIVMQNDSVRSRGVSTESHKETTMMPTKVGGDLKFRTGNGSKGIEESKGVELVINECCRSEQKYFDILNTFLSTFCEKLNAVVNGREGDNERKALGLTASDVSAMFGKRLMDVRDVSGKFNALLGVLTDFGSPVMDERGKLGVLLDAFSEIFPKLKVLGPYMAQYKHVIELIHQRTGEIRKNRKKKKKKKGLNFLQIWELERVKHENLRLSSLENVLIKPVQRIPQYKILLKELVKKAEKDNHPALLEVQEMVAEINALGHSLDKQVNTANDKAKKLLG